MKNIVKFAGVLLILLVAMQDMEAQRGMRGFRNDSAFVNQRHDSTFMKMHNRRMAMAHGWGRPGMMNPGFCCGRCMNPGMMQKGMGQYGFHSGHGRGMMAYQKGMNPMMLNAPGRRIMESMPGVTAKQKEELTKLNEKQMDEMKKIREKHQADIKALGEDHRKNVMNLLTDEQKKWLEENAPEGSIR